MNIAKSNLDIVENTLSKPQETLELKMNEQKESFSFDIPLELPEQGMMGVTSLDVYDTVYYSTSENNSFQIKLTEEQIEKSDIDISLVFDVEVYHKHKELDFIKIVYGLINITQKVQIYSTTYKISGIFLNIEADTISMKSILTSSNPFRFNSELYTLLRFEKIYYPEGTHK